MQRTIQDWGGNIAAFVVVILANVLSNALPINNQTMPEISAKYPSLFTPSGFTFSIWGVIYLGLLIFVVYQALPSQRGNGRCADISKLFQFNCVANAAWIVVWHYDLLALSLLVMFAILASLILIYRQLGATDSPIVALPFRIYTAWICVATIANISVLQTAYGLDDIGISAVDWTLLKIALAGAIATVIVVRNRDIYFAGVVVWAAYGIATKQVATPAVAGAALAAMYLLAMLIIYSLVSRLAVTKQGTECKRYSSKTPSYLSPAPTGE